MAEPNAAFVPALQPNPAEVSNPTSTDADFRVEKKETRNWRISLLSARARHWFEANFANYAQAQSVRVIETNLAGANAFIRKARIDGFRTEYIGPLSKSYF